MSRLELTRLERIVLALEAWLDHFPHPETWTSQLQRRSTKRGPAPFRSVVCDDCGGEGKRRGGWVCQTCKGRGRRTIDDYTGEDVSTSETPLAQLLARTVNCSSCGGWGRLSAFADQRPDRSAPLCERCEGTGREPAPMSGRIGAGREEQRSTQGDAVLDALQLQRERRDELAVYVDLARTMTALRAADRGACSLVVWAYVTRERPVETLSIDELERLVAGLMFLEREMPHRIHLPADVLSAHSSRHAARVRAKGKTSDTRAQGERNEEIRRRRRRGATLDELAGAFNIDKSTASRICQGVPRGGGHPHPPERASARGAPYADR